MLGLFAFARLGWWGAGYLFRRRLIRERQADGWDSRRAIPDRRAC